MALFRKLPLILLVALFIRLWFLWDYAAHRPTHALGMIPFLFEPGNIAASIASGNGFASPFRVETGPTAWMAPVYPLLLAGIFKLFGLYTFQAFLAAAGLNVLFSTLTCIPLYAAASRMFGRGVAAGAAWLWAIFPNAILLTYESMFEGSLSALLVAALLWSTLVAADSTRLRDWALNGLLWGAALMTNASVVALLPFLFGWAEYRAHQRPGFTFARPALAALVTVLCCSPWAIRNYLVFHEFVPLRSVGGLALWLGNNEQGASISPDRLHPISNQAERDHYVEVGEMEYMREKQALALDYIPKHPAHVLRLSVERFTAFWSGGSASLVHDFSQARSLRFFFVIPFNLIVSLAAFVGLILLWKGRNPHVIPLAAFPLVFPLVFYVALAHARYKHPIDPALLLLSAFAMSRLPKMARLTK
ncbi:MAG: hypothetical protein JWN34_6297 [Bryobacterales bacterium]|nr:hypothetical protein [Bryobacterales bacterium]